MKIGPVEGTPEEIKGFMENNGLQADRFFQPAERPIATVWFIVPAALVVISIGVLTMVQLSWKGASTFVFLAGCGCALWLAANIQLRFKNVWAAAGVLIGCILFLLVALGVLLPADLPEQARKWRD